MYDNSVSMRKRLNVSNIAAIVYRAMTVCVKTVKQYLAKGLVNLPTGKASINRGVIQLVECVVWDHDAAGSSPVTPTKNSKLKNLDFS